MDIAVTEDTKIKIATCPNCGTKRLYALIDDVPTPLNISDGERSYGIKSELTGVAEYHYDNTGAHKDGIIDQNASFEPGSMINCMVELFVDDKRVGRFVVLDNDEHGLWSKKPLKTRGDYAAELLKYSVRHNDSTRPKPEDIYVAGTFICPLCSKPYSVKKES